MSRRNARTATGRPARMAALVMTVAMFVAACGGSSASVSPSPSASADTSCAPENLALKTPGVLTLSTDNPAYSPWFQGGNEGADVWIGDYNNDPAKGQGYEGAVAYAVAEKLGFAAADVVWIHTTFDASFAPGAKEFDLFLYMAGHPNRVIPHAALLEAVWGEACQEQPEYLRVFMGQLRKKLEPDPSTPRYLVTEPWVGYRFIAEPL